MERRPVIGISGSWHIECHDPVFLGEKLAYVTDDYVRSVYQNGGTPLVLPLIPMTVPGAKEMIADWFERIDALILSGGHDINPSFYGQEPRQKLRETCPERDVFDLYLLEQAKERKIPVLGICRGFQLIVVAYGGQLLQDLEYADRELLKHNQGHRPDLPTQKVNIVPGSWLEPLYGASIQVNSFHHQVAMELPEGLRPAAEAMDGVIEAVEAPEDRVYAVQWHPEMMSGSSEAAAKIFKLFMEMAKG